MVVIQNTWRQLPLSRKGRAVLLAFLFFLGLLCGVLSFHDSGTVLFPMMRSLMSKSVSIVSIVSIVAFPFLISVVSVALSQRWILFFICFFKAFLFGYVSTGIMAVFQPVGWLFRTLLLFSDCVSMPLLFFFWIRHISGSMCVTAAEILFIFAIFLLIGSVDYRFIVPLLVRLV